MNYGHTCRECGAPVHTDRDVMISRIMNKVKSFQQPFFTEEERIFLASLLNGVLQDQRYGR